ncbi:MAG: hypothetical protein IKI24_07345 [Clostridia bacterium]|nr:hypothetical protein [Clostridia bacterium]
MVRPVSFKGFQKGFQGVSLRGFRGFQIFLRKLCVCIKYLSLGEPENVIAKKLYASFGFVEAKEFPRGWDEIPAALKL